MTGINSLPHSAKIAFNRKLLDVKPTESQAKTWYRKDWAKQKKNFYRKDNKRVKHKIKFFMKRRVLKDLYAQLRWDKSLWNPNFWKSFPKMPLNSGTTLTLRRFKI
jgi:hypothetical protein